MTFSQVGDFYGAPYLLRLLSQTPDVKERATFWVSDGLAMLPFQWFVIKSSLHIRHIYNSSLTHHQTKPKHGHRHVINHISVLIKTINSDFHFLTPCSCFPYFPPGLFQAFLLSLPVPALVKFREPGLPHLYQEVCLL